MRVFLTAQVINEGDTPSPLRTAYRPILALRTAYRYFLASHTAYSLTKNNHFGRFRSHKEDKMTIRRIHMYKHS